MLKNLSAKACKWPRKKNITRALITCNIENFASRAVILANGGQLENIHNETERYWIDLE